MNSINDVIKSLKERISFHENIDYKNGCDIKEFYECHRKEEEKLIEIMNYLENIAKNKNSSDSLYVTPKDLEGLPQELIDQLGLSESDKQDFFLMDVIEDLGGIASIDKIMIQAYRKNKEIFERQKLSAKLYRMLSKGLIYSLPNKKGVYSLKPVSEEEEKDMEN